MEAGWGGGDGAEGVGEVTSECRVFREEHRRLLRPRGARLIRSTSRRPVLAFKGPEGGGQQRRSNASLGEVIFQSQVVREDASFAPAEVEVGNLKFEVTYDAATRPPPSFFIPNSSPNSSPFRPTAFAESPLDYLSHDLPSLKLQLAQRHSPVSPLNADHSLARPGDNLTSPIATAPRELLSSSP